MLIQDVKKLSVFERWVYWIKERESIRIQKEEGVSKPWTNDAILQSYRFCNVRRMDDKVSQWLLKNWYEPYFNHKNMLLACALARFINLPESLAEVGFPVTWSPQYIKEKLRKRRDHGEQIFNGAYMVRGNDGIDKIECVVDYYVNPLRKVLIDSCSVESGSMEMAVATIQSCFGFGSFMAGQVVADLRHAIKGAWLDKYTWAPMGPGSRRGMNRLLNRDISTPIHQDEFTGYLRIMSKDAAKHIPQLITLRLEAIDWQNTMCEFDKYERTLFDGRHPKSLYPGAA